MRIRFLRDFQGVNTAERFYRAGEVADLPTGAAVVAEGAAEFVPDEEPAPTTPTAAQPEPPAVPRRGRKAGA